MVHLRGVGPNRSPWPLARRKNHFRMEHKLEECWACNELARTASRGPSRIQMSEGQIEDGERRHELAARRTGKVRFRG